MISHSKTPVEKINFNLEKYFQHIKLASNIPFELTLGTLKKIISHHNANFPYHNTPLYNAGKVSIPDRKIPSLDKDYLFADMVKNHGGYCFQQLELLYTVLSELGFKLHRYTAKIILRPCGKMNIENTEKIKTHELLIIELDKKRYLVDSGMANLSLREPLEFKEGHQKIDDDEYRLTKDKNDVWTLDTKTITKDKWFCMYQFLDVSVDYDEIIKHHTDLYLTPDFREIRDDRYLTGITTPEKRKYVIWFFKQPQSPENFGIYSSTKKNSNVEKKKELTTIEEATNISKVKFGIR
jgi:N-hydroxyarylamine O-acetyltransferase